MKESEHVSHGSSCPQSWAASCELTPQGLPLRSVGSAGLGQPCAESWQQSLVTVSLIVNKGTVGAPFGCLLSWCPEILLLLESKESGEGLARV